MCLDTYIGVRGDELYMRDGDQISGSHVGGFAESDGKGRHNCTSMSKDLRLPPHHACT